MLPPSLLQGSASLPLLAPFKAIEAEILNATMLMFWPKQSFYFSSDEIDKGEVREFCGDTLAEKRASEPGKQDT